MGLSAGDRGPARPQVGSTRKQASGRQLALGCLSVLLILGLGYVFLVAPVLQRQGYELQIMQTALNALPPYPSSTQVYVDAPNEFGVQPDIVVGYRYQGRCTDVQNYYTTQALNAAWSVAKPLYVVSGGDPSADEYHTDYQKTASGLRLTLSVGCFVQQDGANAGDPQDIYTLHIFQTP